MYVRHGTFFCRRRMCASMRCIQLRRVAASVFDGEMYRWKFSAVGSGSGLGSRRRVTSSQ